VSRAREFALSVAEVGNLRCAWSDRPLSRSTLDIDHMFPWTAWLCSDLWNLLPAHREVNQRLKRDRLPSATTLFRAEGWIIGWWRRRTSARAESYLAEQFLQEARASLPAFVSDLQPGCPVAARDQSL
jgi:HNH endonuclease